MIKFLLFIISSVSIFLITFFIIEILFYFFDPVSKKYYNRKIIFIYNYIKGFLNGR